jgi:hypothetical protein
MRRDFPRAAYGALLKAAEEMRTLGTVDFLNDAVPFTEINAMFASEET